MSNGKDRYDLELEIVEFVDEGENKYGIKAVAILKKNKSPEDGAEIEFFVSGAPVGNESSDENGRATIDVTRTSFAPIIVVEAVMKEYPFLRRKATKRVREEKKEDKAIRINVLNAFKDGDNFVIIVARVNAKGAGVSGELKYFEPTTKQMCLKSTDAHGVATIKIPLGDKEQKTFIFPAERPGDQVEKEIPSQQEESKKTEPICVEETKISISERWRAAVERGRQKARGGK